MKKESLSFSRQVAYAIGQLGWSILINIIGFHQVYFYLPPEEAGFPELIIKVAFFGISTIGLISALGRLWDGVTDPLIANLSDRWESKWGRRIPFLATGGLPGVAEVELGLAVAAGGYPINNSGFSGGGGAGGQGGGTNGDFTGTGGGGAGGYAGNGGAGAAGYTQSSATPGVGGGGGGGGAYVSGQGRGSAGGGGVGILGQGSNGAASINVEGGGAGSGGSAGASGNGGGGAGGLYGGGGGGGTTNSTGTNYVAGPGGGGAVRIIWGPNRLYPSTNTANV